MSQYFPKPYETFGGDIKDQPYLSNYATKADIKNISHVDTSSFVLKTNLANLKTKVDKLGIDKLKPPPDDVSKLSNLVTAEVAKKADYDAKITDLENKIPDINNLATKTALTSLENKIPNTSNLATKIELTAVENKIPDISNLATKTALTNFSDIVPDISTLIKKVTMIQKLEKLKTNMSKILDLTQN